jgi:hypothetical protein
VPSSTFTPQLRPLSMGEILDAGFKLFRHRFGALMVCALVPVVPLTILSMVVVASTDPTAFDVDGTAMPGDDGSVIIGNLLDRLFTGAAAALAVAACFKIISSAYLGERASAGESLRYGLTRLLALMVAYIVLSILVPIGLIFLLIPGIFLAVKWSLTYAAIAGERTGPFAGMGRSWELTKGHWWRTFGTLVIVALLALVLTFALLAVIGAGAAASDSISDTAYAVVITLATIIVLAIVYPLLAAIITVLYYDLRVRNEGFDLQLLARGVGSDTSRFDAAPERPDAQPVGSTPVPTSSSGGFAPPEGPAAAS